MATGDQSQGLARSLSRIPLRLKDDDDDDGRSTQIHSATTNDVFICLIAPSLHALSGLDAVRIRLPSSNFMMYLMCQIHIMG